jgi:hypothetical protein
MVLAQKQTHRIEEPKLNPHNYSHLIFDKGTYIGEKQPLHQMMLEKLDVHTSETKTKLLSLTLYKNQFKMYQKTECKTRNFETAREKHLKRPKSCPEAWATVFQLSRK